MLTINRPCYATREEVRRALDVKQAAYNDVQVDRQLIMASDGIDKLCNRRFYPLDATKSWDWPNYQYAYPWRIWLDKWELAAAPTLFVTGPYLVTPVVIPSANYILQPINSGPPFTSVELRRDMNSFYGANTTPQNDIQITGTFGYWMQTLPAGNLAAIITDTTSTGVTVTVGTGAAMGVGDMIIVDSERMLVQDANYVTTTATNISGATTASAADNTIAVTSGLAFAKGETILIDSEAMLVQNIVGNSLVVKRAFDGTVLVTHNAGTTIWARRLLTCIRGAAGTQAATHLNNAAVVVSVVPGLVKELAVAEAVVGVTLEPSAYAGGVMGYRTASVPAVGTTQGQQKEPMPGIGLPDLRDRTYAAFGRKARSRVI